MLFPILAGIGALCMSNPRRAKSRRRKARRRNPKALRHNIRVGAYTVNGRGEDVTYWKSFSFPAAKMTLGEAAKRALKRMHVAHPFTIGRRVSEASTDAGPKRLPSSVSVSKMPRINPRRR